MWWFHRNVPVGRWEHFYARWKKMVHVDRYADIPYMDPVGNAVMLLDYYFRLIWFHDAISCDSEPCTQNLSFFDASIPYDLGKMCFKTITIFHHHQVVDDFLAATFLFNVFTYFLLFPIARGVFGGLPQPPDLTHQCATWPKGLSLVAQILGFAGWHGFSEERGWGLDECWG